MRHEEEGLMVRMPTVGPESLTRQARVEQTRTLILDAAERLFAEHGVVAVSNRQVSEAAGQGNNTAVGYHFGTKTDLVRAIVRRHQVDIGARRARMVADVPSEAGVRDWVACLVQPTADHLQAIAGPDGVTYYARLTAQLLADPELRELLVAEALDDPALDSVTAGLDARRAEMPDMVRRERANMSRQLITWGFAEREKARQARPSGPDWPAYAVILIDSLTGMWVAPWTA